MGGDIGSKGICQRCVRTKYIPEYIDDWRKVWTLQNDPRLSVAEKVALLFTFDDAFIPKDNLIQAAEYFIEFADLTENDPAMSSRVNHWRAIAESLVKASTNKDHRLRGVCISCTSVDDVWAMRSPKDFDKAWPIFQNG